MKRESTLLIATLLVVLIASVSFLSVPIGVSQDNVSEALIELGLLHGEVSGLPDHAFKDSHAADGHRKALTYKIKAVITQIEAGAINGSINKLENDLINAVTNWMTPEFADGFVKKIRHIIDLLRGIYPPPPPPKKDFAVIAFPDFLNISLGGRGTATIMVISINGFNKPVDLAVTSELISGVAFYLDPQEVTPPPNDYATSTLFVTVGSTAPPGSYTITVEGTSGTLEDSVDISLGIAPSPRPQPSLIEVVSVLRFPETPNYDEDVTVIAQVESERSPIDRVLLSCSINTVDWTNVTMTLAEELYSAMILHKPYQTTVSYKVYANNTDGKTDVSDTYSYVVVDSHPPAISGVERSLATPNYNDTVTVIANVTEPAGASGVKLPVLLGLTAGLVQTNITMSFEGGKYKGIIDEFSFGTLVKYKILASDEADNWDVSDEASYTVGDKTAPTIETPSWTPRTPLAHEKVSVTVKISDHPMGSGVKDATLWYRNSTVRDWQPVIMIAEDMNWTATIPGQGGGSNVEFYIEASDNAGNVAEKRGYEFTAIVPPSIPLWLLLLIILIILAVIGATVYYMRRRWKRAAGKVGPTPRPKGYPMVSFIVPAHNEESRIAGCINSMFESAGDYPAPSEIIVVDDGSTDLTYETACATVEMNRSQWPHVKGRVVRHTTNLGRTEAVRTGLTMATRNMICVVDPGSWQEPTPLSELVESRGIERNAAAAMYT